MTCAHRHGIQLLSAQFQYVLCLCLIQAAVTGPRSEVLSNASPEIRARCLVYSSV